MKRLYGTKVYAVKVLRDLMREWAKAKRARAQDSTRWSLEHTETIAYGQVLGARTALCSVGVLDSLSPQYERLNKRIQRIIYAKTTRRPFGELRRAA